MIVIIDKYKKASYENKRKMQEPTLINGRERASSKNMKDISLEDKQHKGIL